MLSKAQQQNILSLQTKKGRQKSGLCLVEGEKTIETAGEAMVYTFTPDEVGEELFAKLVTTQTPQRVAGVARVPVWDRGQVLEVQTIVVLDHVQDPGNIGAALRLCLGFRATLVCVESTDLTNPKIIRGSAGAFFHVPWMSMSRTEAETWLKGSDRTCLALEAHGASGAAPLSAQRIALIAGSEGQGVTLSVGAQAYTIAHEQALESLNVSTALAIVLATRYQQLQGRAEEPAL